MVVTCRSTTIQKCSFPPWAAGQVPSWAASDQCHLSGQIDNEKLPTGRLPPILWRARSRSAQPRPSALMGNISHSSPENSIDEACDPIRLWRAAAIGIAALPFFSHPPIAHCWKTAGQKNEWIEIQIEIEMVNALVPGAGGAEVGWRTKPLTTSQPHDFAGVMT